MKGPFGRDGFLGEMDRWWLYNKMREEQEQEENDDLDLYDDEDLFDSTVENNNDWDTDEDEDDDDEDDDDFTDEELEFLSCLDEVGVGGEGPDENGLPKIRKRFDGSFFSYIDISEDYDMMEKYPEYRDVRIKQIAMSVDEKDKKEALTEWYKKIEKKKADMARISYELEIAKRNQAQQKERLEAQQKKAREMKEQQEQQHYPRIVVNWGALKIWAIIMIVCLILIGILRTLTEYRAYKYEKELREKVEALTANTTTTTRQTTQETVETTTPQTTTQQTTTRRKTTRKKASTKKDKYNVYDYADPEDFYEDNYDDFWDYEDAEDYYREKWKQK